MPYGIDNDEFPEESEDLQADVAKELRPSLFDEVRRVLRVHHYSIRTEDAYVGWIRRFIELNGCRHPRQLGARELETFLSRLAVDGKVSAVPRIRHWRRSCFCIGMCSGSAWTGWRM
jgi:hypothetical protein